MRIRTSGWASTTRSAVLSVALSLTGVAGLHAQVLSVTSVRPLGFGDVLPGVPTTVHPTDPARSGQFEITGPPSAAVEITFSLPEALGTTQGGELPISFGATSAGCSVSGSISRQVFFDPKVPFRTTLSEFGRATCFIGGTLEPPSGQRPGSYNVPISITLALVGL
jgi:Domain of unknown function (DUF4402)